MSQRPNDREIKPIALPLLLPSGLALLLLLVLFAGVSPEAFASNPQTINPQTIIPQTIIPQTMAQVPIPKPVVGAPANPEAGNPKLSCEISTQNFGELIKGVPYEHTFLIRNLGDATLKITKVNGT